VRAFYHESDGKNIGYSGLKMSHARGHLLLQFATVILICRTSHENFLAAKKSLTFAAYEKSGIIYIVPVVGIIYYAGIEIRRPRDYKRCRGGESVHSTF